MNDREIQHTMWSQFRRRMKEQENKGENTFYFMHVCYCPGISCFVLSKFRETENFHVLEKENYYRKIQ